MLAAGAVATSSSLAGNRRPEASSRGRSIAGMTVAVSVPQEVDPYFIAITNYFKKAAQAQGLKVLTANANGSVATQVQQVESFVSEGVKAIAIDSINDQTIVPAIKDANRHGIPVFTIDTQPYASAMKAEGAHIVQTVESNNPECGRVSTEQMLAWLHGRSAVIGKVILPLAQSTVDRNNSFNTIMKSHRNDKVVATVNGEAQYAVALTATQQMLSGHPGINVIWTTDGPAATGAYRAIIGKHLVGKVHLFGNATVVPADQAIESGKVMIAGATQFPSVEGATIGYDVGQYLKGNHKQTYLEFTPCNPVTHANSKVVTAYNEAVFGGNGNEPVQVLLHGKFYQFEAHGRLKEVTLP
ncbi:MAG: substrate-binding domain-containing protein [Actinomycetota bacterium]|nr:substrate-binding domain-containing protein [Actinomycetota bacterium]